VLDAVVSCVVYGDAEWVAECVSGAFTLSFSCCVLQVVLAQHQLSGGLLDIGLCCV
jgi:hypothetical protein